MAAVGCGDDAHMELSAAKNYIMKFKKSKLLLVVKSVDHVWVGMEQRVGRRGNRVASRGCMLQILWEFSGRTSRWRELKGLSCHWPFTQLGLTSLMFWLPRWRQAKSCYRTRVETFRILMLFYPHSLYSVCQIHVFQPWVVVILFQEWNAKKKNFACSLSFAKKKSCAPSLFVKTITLVNYKMGSGIQFKNPIIMVAKINRA